MKKKNLFTPFGEKVAQEEMPLNDYPRPQLVRDNWQNLNGSWFYVINQQEEKPSHWTEKIRVPFSPESLLSGVQKNVRPEDRLWYKRDFHYEMAKNKKVILHFGAVDQVCEVWLNGILVGSHEGGYWPFSIDITSSVKAENELIVKVKDASDNSIHAYGKQKQVHGEIWYTPQSGIWQTVWLEEVPKNYVTTLNLTPKFDEKMIQIQIEMVKKPESVEVVIRNQGKEIHRSKTQETLVEITLPHMIPWTPDTPHLYDVEIIADQDCVKSYFGMRKFSIGKNNQGHTVPLLNNEPIFYNGLLDQGYWSDGLYTPPSDDAMIYDITVLKELGYNMLRKHIKVEPLRWYYHCDRLGMLVWQDFVSGGEPEYNNWVIKYLPFVNIQLKDDNYPLFRRASEKSRKVFQREMEETIALLKNVTSLAVWVPFNEGWGQFDSTAIGDRVRELDATRLVDYVSGYHDQGKGDFKSPHIYFKKYRLKPDKHDRIQILSEFGGYSCPTENHMTTDKLFGYKMYKTKEKLTTAYVSLYEREIIPAIEKGLSGTVYTQVSDVEEEINGLLTYDRRVLKLDRLKIKALNQRIYDVFKEQNKE